MGRVPRVTLRRFECAVALVPCLVEPAEHQRRPPQRVVRAAAVAKDASRHLTLKELLAFTEPAQRLTWLAELRKHPCGVGDCPRKHDDDVPGPHLRDPMFD